jgi:hypothetical protein
LFRLLLCTIALLLCQCTPTRTTADDDIGVVSPSTTQDNPAIITVTTDDTRIPEATPTTRSGLTVPLATPKPRIDTSIVKASETPKMLRFVRESLNEAVTCVAIRIQGIDTSGWRVTIDGLKLTADFDDNGTARVCGLRAGSEFTFTVRDAKDAPVAGGAGIPARDTAIMLATWE